MSAANIILSVLLLSVNLCPLIMDSSRLGPAWLIYINCELVLSCLCWLGNMPFCFFSLSFFPPQCAEMQLGQHSSIVFLCLTVSIIAS